MSYFSHPYLSNSDLKDFGKKIGIEREMPANMEAIFSFGTLFHKVILEPNRVTDEDRKHPDYALADKMRLRYWEDPIARMVINGHDFEREHEFYATVQVGGMEYNARCKADGYRNGISTLLELKGLRVTHQKGFEEALLNFDYDRAAVHYMLTSKCDKVLIVGISKSDPKKLFRKVVKKHDEFYAWGEEKLKDRLRLLYQYSPDDVRLL
jgi:hypothetical protein